MKSTNNIIIEGVDRLGKDTLINGLLNKLGFFQVVHYQKPLKLQALDNSLAHYQTLSFEKMFSMLDQGGMLLNRAHLGEIVYAPRYRGYSGDYVFQLESEHPVALSNTLLVVLYASSWAPIHDDGESFDFTKKDEEQADFIKAYEHSAIKHKLFIDVTDGSGGTFIPRAEILERVTQRYMGLLNKT